jgi:hypothetical protein
MATPDPAVEVLLAIGQLAAAMIKDPFTAPSGDRLRLLRLVEELWPRYRRGELAVGASILLAIAARELLNATNMNERQFQVMADIAIYFQKQHAIELAELHFKSEQKCG